MDKYSGFGNLNLRMGEVFKAQCLCPDVRHIRKFFYRCGAAYFRVSMALYFSLTRISLTSARRGLMNKFHQINKYIVVRGM